MCLDGHCEHNVKPLEPDTADVRNAGAGLGRRRLLLAGGAGAAALTLAPVSFARAADGPAGAAPANGSEATRTITGFLETGVADFVHLPVEVPRGIRKIAVSYSYDKPSVPSGVPGNSCDIGVFDERGSALGGRGFRGWSGGFRTSFEIGAGEATPGYLPGPVNPGTWNIVLGPYQVAPQGMNYRVEVTLTYGERGPAFVPHHPPQRAKGRGRDWYRGDCHLHTVHSDGKRLPAEVAAGARAAGLDFMVSTDHNTSSSHAVWGEHAGPDLLIIPGEEVTTRNGHWLALGLPAGEWVDWRYRSRDDAFDRFARQVHRNDGLVVPAHMYCAYVACQWKFGFENADATEVWTGPWTYDDEHAVSTWDQKLGEAVHTRKRWLPAMGNSDAHSEPQVIGLPHNVVHADDLATDSLMKGIREGRSWIAESASVELAFTATGGGRQAGIGEKLTVPAEAPVDIRLDVRGVPHGTVRFITDEGQMHQESVGASGTGTVVWRTTASLAAYVRAEVRHPMADGSPGQGNTMGDALLFGPMAAMTNPVFLERKGR
ncbi:CehA/McbA family metallohydrolase [Streptomyces sp. 6-11-2]|uniref:CehA/McbA family metallohydrolase n=1 Tax=Streptomyces sp. 6-11-2 TaxID=2585753 RepID=UPI001169CC74|nr:CehA/McbA family metallohydrolase [Streptomyces sp. 6-11-2]GED83675.1 phosphoesterase [Streptomyces sp. 6-11-2]